MAETKQCAALTKSGKPCKNLAKTGEDYCSSHLRSMQDSSPELEEVKEEVPEDNLCGHVNLHSRDKNGRQDFLSCTKPKGHEGNHGAYHYEVHYGSRYRDDMNPRLIHRDVIKEGMDWREWNDMAGIPVEDIKPDPHFYEKQRQKRALELLSK